jgi:hypothetical protein
VQKERNVVLLNADYCFVGNNFVLKGTILTWSEERKMAAVANVGENAIENTNLEQDPKNNFV